MEDRPRSFKIVIKKPNGVDEELMAHMEKVTLGSGAHCEVRLPIEHSAVEHVELSINNGRIFARAKAFEPAPTLGGSPFVQAFVDPGVEIGIGPLRIVPTLAEGISTKITAEKGKKSNSTRLLLMGGAAAVLLVTALGGDDGADPLAAGAGIVAPPLWGPPITACPQNAPAQALALADERRRMAEGKRERRPFHLQDGIASVPLFEIAAVCYTAAGEPAVAAATAQAAKDLRTKVNEDYHAHQVRLEHALAVKDGATTWHEVSALLAMTDGLNGPYVSWLASVQRAMRQAATKS